MEQATPIPEFTDQRHARRDLFEEQDRIDCITSCPASELAERLKGVASATAERLNGLERWQLAQNGTLKRLEEKQDAATVRSDDKLDRLFFMLLGSLFTALLALAGIIVTLLRPH